MIGSPLTVELVLAFRIVPQRLPRRVFAAARWGTVWVIEWPSSTGGCWACASFPFWAIFLARPAEMVHNPSSTVSDDRTFIGVDCGGTHLRAMAADPEGRTRAELTWPTNAAQEKEDGLRQAIVALVAELTARGTIPAPTAVAGIGVGLPCVCHDGAGFLFRNVRSLDLKALQEELHERHGAPVALMNDVKCSALGEAWRGAAVGADPFVFLNVGTGLSAALFAGGRVYQGAHHAAGEIAYCLTGGSQSSWAADGLGPLEEAFSGVGLSGAYGRASPAGETPTAEEIFRRADAGEPLASRIIEQGLGALLPAIVNLCVFADPGLLVIDGGVSRGLVPRREAIETMLKEAMPFPPRVVWSTLHGKAGLLGTIRLAMLAGAGETF